MLQRQVLAERHYRDLFHPAERQTDLDVALHRLIDKVLIPAKKRRRRIRKRIGLQRTERQRGHAVQMTPEQRLR